MHSVVDELAAGGNPVGEIAEMGAELGGIPQSSMTGKLRSKCLALQLVLPKTCTDHV
jgi:hypothetical protein